MCLKIFAISIKGVTRTSLCLRCPNVLTWRSQLFCVGEGFCTPSQSSTARLPLWRSSPSDYGLSRSSRIWPPLAPLKRRCSPAFAAAPVPLPCPFPATLRLGCRFSRLLSRSGQRSDRLSGLPTPLTAIVAGQESPLLRSPPRRMPDPLPFKRS